MNFPCPQIKNFNQRYVRNYNVNIIENARSAEWNIQKFLKSQKELFTCSSCGGIINQHRKICSECGREIDFLALELQKIKDDQGRFILLEKDEYKDRKNLIKKLEVAYGNEHIFKYAMLKLLKEHEKKATSFGLYFGFQKDPMSLSERGKILNISSARVGVLCKAAFRRLNWYRFREEVWEEYGYKEKEER
jgi:DNA-directed RNA polymerase specialized sigma subunit